MVTSRAKREADALATLEAEVVGIRSQGSIAVGGGGQHQNGVAGLQPCIPQLAGRRDEALGAVYRRVVALDLFDHRGHAFGSVSERLA